MAITISSITLLKEYFDGVMSRAGCHANNVMEITLPLIGGVIWKATDDVYVRELDGAPKNVLWMPVRDETYCFVFNHHTQKIEVREGKMNGATLKSFDNTTPLSEVKRFFDTL